MLDATVSLPTPLSWNPTQSPIMLGAVAVDWPFCIGWITQVSSAESFFVAGSQK